MIEFRVERAQLADWQRIRSIRLRSLADAPDAFGTTLAEDAVRPDAEWRARVENDAVANFLAMTADRNCLGMAVGAPHTDYSDTAGLFGMWVASEARGRGVGTTLVEAVIGWARNENYKRVLLDVGDENAVAIRLYESCGFVPTGKTGTLPPPRQHILEHERALNLE
jgi:ribosomal protein S18 acetylase RimI-like enzyme